MILHGELVAMRRNAQGLMRDYNASIKTWFELLEEERVLLVQGSGFNWPQPDHFRLVFLPHEDELRDAISRLARFLGSYRKRHGT